MLGINYCQQSLVAPSLLVVAYSGHDSSSEATGGAHDRAQGSRQGWSRPASGQGNGGVRSEVRCRSRRMWVVHQLPAAIQEPKFQRLVALYLFPGHACVFRLASTCTTLRCLPLSTTWVGTWNEPAALLPPDPDPGCRGRPPRCHNTAQGGTRHDHAAAGAVADSAQDRHQEGVWEGGFAVQGACCMGATTLMQNAHSPGTVLSQLPAVCCWCYSTRSLVHQLQPLHSPAVCRPARHESAALTLTDPSGLPPCGCCPPPSPHS